MAVKVMSWVFEQCTAKMTSGELLVALVLADHCNTDGSLAYPSVRRICEYTRLGESTVRAALGSLVKKGVIAVMMEANGPRPTVYYFPAIWTPPKSGGVNGELTPPKNNSLPLQILAQKKGDTSKEPSIEPSYTPLSPPKGGASRRKPKTFITQEFDPGLTEWDKMAKELGVTDDWLNKRTDQFIDYWIGQGEAKADWTAAWRVWLRKEAERKRR